MDPETAPTAIVKARDTHVPHHHLHDPHPDEPDRTLMTATTDPRTHPLLVDIKRRHPDRHRRPAGGTPFGTIGVYDHETGRILIDTVASLDEILTNRYADHTEIETLDATWNASLY